MERFRVGLNGFGSRSLKSVETMRQNYLRAVSEAFETRFLNTASDIAGSSCFDTIVTYYDPAFWKQPVHPDIPLIFAIHGDAVSRQEFLYQHLEYLETTDTLIVNCHSDTRILRSMFDGPTPTISHLHFPVDLAVFKKQDRNHCIANLSIGKTDLVVGFVARLIPQKNLHQFLRMLAVLKELVAPRKLVGIIVGKFCKPYPILDYSTVPYEHYIRRLQSELAIEQDIYYFGELPPSLLSICYGAMDLLIHPTNNVEEAFGSVPVEAMACGVPVIGAAYGGLKDTIISGETGFLMPTWITKAGIRMDTIYGTKAAFRLLSDHSLREKMSEVCIQRVERFYTYDAFANRLRSTICRAIQQHRNGQSKSIVAARQPQTRQTEGFLPNLPKPWEAYLNVVAEYVSGNRPELRPDSRLQAFGPIWKDASNMYHIDDPVWPGIFHLEDADIQILQSCKRETTLAQLEKHSMTSARIEDLIKLGLLICSN